ncbi:formate dehydrogenase accessory sulfurtransferase FdhD [Sphingomonas sp.]
MNTVRDAGLTRIARDGARNRVDRAVAHETPVAIEANGVAYAVLMATPADLDDLAHGFLAAERVIDAADDIAAIESHAVSGGVVLRVSLTARVAPRILDRVRHRVSDASCGICGIETIEQALRPLPVLAPSPLAPDAAIFAALDALAGRQPLHAATRAVHAAALCDASGGIRLVREDVGRHNAFDKLIGAMARGALGWDGGFALLSSRCSYELVEKAVLARCPMLVTVSAPTALALERGAAAGLALRVVARADAMLAP